MMDNLHNWGTKGFLDRYQRVDGKIVSTTHPLADFSLFLAKKQGKVFLLHAFLSKNLMDAVHNLKRNINGLSNFRIH